MFLQADFAQKILKSCIEQRIKENLIRLNKEFKEDIHPEAPAPKKQPVNDQTMVLDKTLFPDDEGLD